MANVQLIFALDPNDDPKVRHLLQLLASIVPWVKIGFQAFSVLGSKCFEELEELRYKVFLDLKFHDIPNTVARDVGNMTKRGAQMINMHASGGFDMMCAARRSADISAAENGIESPILLGVTILTSMNETIFENHFASQRNLTEHVVYLAEQTKAAGLDGVCASPLEIEPIRKACGDDFVIVTPGIRPEWTSQGDQQRITTPAEAIKRGANYIVVGRPILEANDPVKAARNILNEISKA